MALILRYDGKLNWLWHLLNGFSMSTMKIDDKFYQVFYHDRPWEQKKFKPNFDSASDVDYWINEDPDDSVFKTREEYYMICAKANASKPWYVSWVSPSRNFSGR